MNEFTGIRQNPLWKASFNLSRVLLKLFKDDRGLVRYLVEDIPALAARVIVGDQSAQCPLLEQMEEFCRQTECKLNEFSIYNPEVPMFRAWFRLGQLRTEVFSILYADSLSDMEDTQEFTALAG